jgi:acyl-CoA synthetase (AMP-forming)/AMP-acid ligase II
MTLIDLFDHGLPKHRQATCLVEDGQTLTYGEVSEWTHRIAWALRNAGIQRQECVGTLTPNNLWGYVSILGLQRAGCIWIPLNARSSIEDNINHLKRTGTVWLFYHSDFEPYLDRVRKEVPSIKGVVCVDRGQTGIREWAATVSEGFPPPQHDPRGEIFRITTSGGTTGAPKAVIQNQAGVQSNAATFMALLRHTRTPRFLLCSPMTHAAGIMSFHLLALGGTIYLMQRPDLPKVVDLIETEKITMLMLTPTSIYSLLALPGIRQRDCSSLKYLMFGAAPMSVEKLREAIEVFGPVMMQCYGQTEASTALTCMLPEEYAEIVANPALEHRLQSCGRATPFSSVAVMDEHGKLLPPGERGELVARSGMVMRGYWNAAELDADVSKFGWHHTGDVGYRDEDGYIYIVDRIRDLIITGGFNVFPSDVEQVIWSHPAVQDCAVIGVPDDKWGEAVKAVIELKPGATVTEAEIIELCKARLGSVKAPKTVDIWESLPRSPVGKVLKKTLREQYRAGLKR